MTFNILITLFGIGIVFVIALGFNFLIKKTKPEGLLKKFVSLTGISIVGFFASAVLHNVISGVVSQLFNNEFEEPIFFILATIICPIGLVVGIIGSIVSLIRKKTRS